MEAYTEFIFVKPRSSLGKLSRWAEFIQPKEIGISVVLSTGLVAANPGMATMSCIPLMAPFSTPPVSLNDWMGNKRARAFQRALFGVCTLQGAMALWKFFSGDLVGGFFDTILSGVGMYCCTQDGLTMIPSFIIFAGFNGFMDMLQLLQKFHGVPIYALPFHFAFLRPSLLFLALYLAWHFHKELSAAYYGYASDGPQDSWFVKCFGHDSWGGPIGTTNDNDTGTSLLGSSRPPFSPFGGSAFRLGR